MSVRSPTYQLLCWVPVLLLGPLLVVGCGGGGTYAVDVEQIGQHFLPTERNVEHHPDSLGALSISEAEGKIQYQLGRDLESLTQKWSCTFQSVGVGPSQNSPTYATLRSLELALVSLQPEMGILSLREERARELIKKRRDEYFETLQIVVYWFPQRPGDTGIISGPGTRTRLLVRDSTYQPVQAGYGPLREAFLGAGGTALYRRNTLSFPRTVNGEDILEDVSEIRLEVRRSGSPSSERFTWSWAEGQTAQSDVGRNESGLAAQRIARQ